jgi:transposase
MFADEARFGRMNRPRPCWAPAGIRPKVASQLIREYIYLYGAVAPKDGTCVYLIMPTSNTACFQAFLDVLSRKFARQDILLVLDGAPNHRSGQLVVPENITLLFLPPYSPELNPKENLWNEIREKIFKNYALKSIDHVRQKLNEAILYVERNPDLAQLSQLDEKSQQYQRGGSESFHYTALPGARAALRGAVMRGGGCGGRSSLSCWTSTLWSAASSV